MPSPEQELAVEVGHVDGVHVDDLNVDKAGECQVLEDLTSCREQTLTWAPVRTNIGIHASDNKRCHVREVVRWLAAPAARHNLS